MALYLQYSSIQMLRNARKRQKKEKLDEDAAHLQYDGILPLRHSQQKAAEEEKELMTEGFWMMPLDGGFFKLPIQSGMEDPSEALTPFADILQKHGLQARDQSSLLNMGASYYRDGEFHTGEALPDYWNSFADEMGGGNVPAHQTTSVVLDVPLPDNIAVFTQGKHRFTLRREDLHQASLEDRPAETIDFDSAPSPAMDHNHLLSTLPDQVQSYLEKNWREGTYTPALEEKVAKWVDRYATMVEGAYPAARHLSEAWNHFFHDGPKSSWMSPKNALDRGDGEVGLYESVTQYLTEMTFRRLLAYTTSNGLYKWGGMRKVRNVWVYDPQVKGRVENSRFVVTRPANPVVDSDGLVRINFTFKSQPNRNTTGMSHQGYIKFIPPGFIKRTLRKLGFFKPKTGMDEQVHCHCNCFGAGTLISMEDGTQKPIEEVVVGDRVITHEGRSKAVTHLMRREALEDEPIFEMTTVGFYNPTVVTGDHPLYVLRGNDTCACGCGQVLPPLSKSRTWSPMLVTGRRIIHGHAGWVEEGGPQKKRLTTYLKPLPKRHRTEADFIDDATVIHGDVYDYSDTRYKTALTRVAIKCREHGEFWQFPVNHLRGNGCPICAKNKRYKSSQKRATLPEAPAQEFRWVNCGDLRHKEWFLQPWVRASTTSFDPDYARLLGYYASEGHMASGRQIILTLNLNEWDTIGSDVKSICDKFGWLTKFIKKKGKSGEYTYFNINIYSQEFAQFCKQHVGYGSHTKKLSEIVMSWDNTALKNFFIGLVLGDGTVDVEGKVKYAVFNKNLLHQASHILLRNRVKHTLSWHNKKKQVVQIEVSPHSNEEVLSWLRPYLRDKDVGKHRDEGNRLNYTFEQGQLRTLKTIKPVRYVGWLYDLRVEDDHSYVANGIAVSNCPDFRYRWHKVLADNGASHTPTGQGGDATNVLPVKTNPSNKISLCKHLSSLGTYLSQSKDWSNPAKDYKKGEVATGVNKPPKVKTGAKVEPAP